MLDIDQDALKEIQPELTSGETVLWAGRPSTHVLFSRNEDEGLLSLSFAWGGLATLIEALVVWSLISMPENRTPGVFMMALLGALFAGLGHYLIWGRFLYGAWKKERTYYAVTNRRVIAVQNCRGRQTASADIDSLKVLVKQKRSEETGTLRFAPPLDPWRRSGWSGMFSLEKQVQARELWDPVPIKQGPVFVDVEDADSVYQLISAMRTRKREAAVNAILKNRGQGVTE